MPDGIDFIISSTSFGFMPIIEKRDKGLDGRLYHGGHHITITEAFEKMVKIWNKKETGNILEYRGYKQLKLQDPDIFLRQAYEKYGYDNLRGILDQLYDLDVKKSDQTYSEKCRQDTDL